MEESANQIHFERIRPDTVLDICKLSETLPAEQKIAVADNAISISQAHFSENAWIRAIYLDDKPIGFIMLHIGSDWADGIDCTGIFLWRFMIAKAYQGKGYGKLALNRLIDHLRDLGIPRLYTSYHLGKGCPECFYKKMGFVPTGDYYGDEPEVVLEIMDKT